MPGFTYTCDLGHIQLCRFFDRISVKLVNSITKVVASVLTLILLGTPVAALASCRPAIAMAGHCSGERCPMMHAQQNSGAQISPAPSAAGSCCQVSRLPQAPLKEAIKQEGKTSAAPIRLQTTATAVMPVLTLAETFPVSELALSHPSQALFCTFLI